MQMMQERRTDAKKGKYSYCSVVGRCKRSTKNNLLKFGAAYLPILLGENHWISGVILPAKKDVLLYNPSGVDNRNSVVLQKFLRLIRDEYKRMHNSSDEAVEAYLGQWSLIDAATYNCSAFPLQDNGKCWSTKHVFRKSYTLHPISFWTVFGTHSGYDCGVFTFLFMTLHSQGVPMRFCQNHLYQCCDGYGVRGKLLHMLWKMNEL